MNPIQLILLAFLAFALSRVFLRFRTGQLGILSFSFWLTLFTASAFAVLLPAETTTLARIVGIGRGVDLVVYASIVVLFYLVFRAYIYLEDLRHEITLLVRKLALTKVNKRRK